MRQDDNKCTRESCASVLLQQLCSVYPGRAMIAVVSRGLYIDPKPGLNCTCTPSRNGMSIQIMHSYGK